MSAGFVGGFAVQGVANDEIESHRSGTGTRRRDSVRNSSREESGSPAEGRSDKKKHAQGEARRKRVKWS